MPARSQREVLPPNDVDGSHQRSGERIENRRVEIGGVNRCDFITNSMLVDCDICLLRGASSVFLIDSTFERCIFRPRRQMTNLRLTDLILQNCTFLGKYVGCRFGKEKPGSAAAVRDCDFGRAGLFHLCDFLPGSEITSIRWPAWPHIVVTDLERSARSWRQLKLPDDLRVTQQVVAMSPSIKAVSIYLPAVTQRADDLRDLFASQSYIVVTDPIPSADGG